MKFPEAVRIGPRAKAFAAFLRYGVKISKRDVSALFQKAFNLKISSSLIDGFMDQFISETYKKYKIPFEGTYDLDVIFGNLDNAVDFYNIAQERNSAMIDEQLVYRFRR